jgi:hypothetical protein
MSAREERERGREAPPQRMAETNPPVFPGTSYDFVLQMVFEMQGKLGELTQAIKTLTESSKEHDKEIRHVTKVIYAASLLVPVISVCAIFLLGKLWELIIAPALKVLSH